MRWCGVLLLLMAGCTRNRAEVQCQSNGSGAIECSIRHTTGDDNVETCWDAVIQCRNGKSATAHACQSLAPSQMATKVLSEQDFRGIGECDTPNGFTVANTKIETR